MNKKQKDFIDSFIENNGKLFDAIKSSEITCSDFNSWLADDSEFTAEFTAVKDLVSENSFMGLVSGGHPQAVIEYQKQQRQRVDVDSLNRMKYEAMAELLLLCETKTQILRFMANVFTMEVSTAEKLYRTVMIERKLESPAQRMKQVEGDNENLLVEKFKRGQLAEIEMYKKLMEIHLKDTEKAEYPSERQRATDKVIDIQRRLEEIEEREKKKIRESDISIADKLDAILLGCSQDQIETTSAKIVTSDYVN